MVGVNEGGQLNILVFELVMITEDPMGILEPLVTTVAIHPLQVAPTSIRYTDETRGHTAETAVDVHDEIAGRKLRVVQLDGSFGVESRGMGLIVGTGELRFQRFYNEIVRMADAVDQRQVDAAKDLTRSPGLGLTLKPYDPERSYFAVNFYDFWFQRSFAVRIPRWVDSRSYSKGGGNGLTWYQCTLREAGPIVTGGIGTTVISTLFDVLTTWNNVNQLLESYTLDTIVGSFEHLAGILVTQAEESLKAIQAQVNGVTAVIGGLQTPDGIASIRNDDDGVDDFGGFATYIEDNAELAAVALELADSIANEGLDTQAETGRVRWADQSGEGSVASIERAERVDELHRLAFAANFQQVAGVFAGLSRAEYQALLEATAEGQRAANVKGTTTHRVTSSDTPGSISTTYGVAWQDILDLNRLLPDEAMLPNTVLTIPTLRVVGAQNAIEGLPVFDSHAGQSAWGKDLDVSLAVDATGSIRSLSGEEVLVQGVDWLIADFAEVILGRLQGMPDDTRVPFLRNQLASILGSDRRIASVVEVRADLDDSGEYNLDVLLAAINGGTISVGA